MAEIRIRPAERSDLPGLTEIYNHYVLHTSVTFDLEPYTVERRAGWFEQFAPSGRHRLLAAVADGEVLGYAGTMRWRPKAAYDTTVDAAVGVFREVGRKFGRYWDVAWTDRPLRLPLTGAGGGAETGGDER